MICSHDIDNIGRPVDFFKHHPGDSSNLSEEIERLLRAAQAHAHQTLRKKGTRSSFLAKLPGG
jgi:hypothetical protein